MARELITQNASPPLSIRYGRRRRDIIATIHSDDHDEGGFDWRMISYTYSRALQLSNDFRLFVLLFFFFFFTVHSSVCECREKCIKLRSLFTCFPWHCTLNTALYLCTPYNAPRLHKLCFSLRNDTQQLTMSNFACLIGSFLVRSRVEKREIHHRLSNTPFAQLVRYSCSVSREKTRNGT